MSKTLLQIYSKYTTIFTLNKKHRYGQKKQIRAKKIFQFCAVLGIFITPKNMNKLPTFNKGKNWALLKRWWIQNKERNVLNWTLLNNNKISQLWILYQKVNIQKFSCKFDQMWTNVQRIFLSAKMHFHSYTCLFISMF